MRYPKSRPASRTSTCGRRCLCRHIADRAVGANNDFLVFFRDTICHRLRLPIRGGASSQAKFPRAASPSSPCSCLPSQGSGPQHLSSFVKAASQKCRSRISLSRGRKSYSMSRRSMVSRWRLQHRGRNQVGDCRRLVISLPQSRAASRSRGLQDSLCLASYQWDTRA